MAATGELKPVALTRSDAALRATTKNGDVILEEAREDEQTLRKLTEITVKPELQEGKKDAKDALKRIKENMVRELEPR
jgi:hypothetical protein